MLFCWWLVAEFQSFVCFNKNSIGSFKVTTCVKAWAHQRGQTRIRVISCILYYCNIEYMRWSEYASDPFGAHTHLGIHITLLNKKCSLSIFLFDVWNKLWVLIRLVRKVSFLLSLNYNFLFRSTSYKLVSFQNGTSVCNREVCPHLPCPKSEQLPVKKSCCMTCPKKKRCEYQGLIYSARKFIAFIQLCTKFILGRKTRGKKPYLAEPERGWKTRTSSEALGFESIWFSYWNNYIFWNLPEFVRLYKYAIHLY